MSEHNLKPDSGNADTFRYLLFTLDNRRFGIHIDAVERTLRAAAVTPLANAAVAVAAHILGVVNVQGSILPVVSLRRIYGLPARDLDPNDRFVIVRVGTASLVLVVDEVLGVESCSERELVAAGTFAPGLKGLRAIAYSDGQIAILHSLETLDSLESLPDAECVAQLQALSRAGARAEIA